MGILLRIATCMYALLVVGANQFDGHPRGLYTTANKEILAPIYSEIEYVGHGLFFARDISPVNPYDFGTSPIIVDKNGRKLSFVLPDKCQLQRVVWLGKEADEQPTLEFQSLPKDTLFFLKMKQIRNLVYVMYREMWHWKLDSIRQAMPVKVYSC